MMYEAFHTKFQANPHCQIGGYHVPEEEEPEDVVKEEAESKDTDEGADEDKKINMMEQMAKLWLQQEV